MKITKNPANNVFSGVDSHLYQNPPSPMMRREDGEDHINVGPEATTTLGKALEFRSRIGFKHTLFGNFDNIEGFWFYIRSEEKDDRLRTLTGFALTKFVKTLTLQNVKNFKAIILDAIYQRIYQNDELYEMFKKSTLPFEYYHTNEAGIRIRPNFFRWLLAGLEEIRLAIQEDRDPRFETFMDNRSVDIYYYVLPQKTKH